jgi:hypothetical protein
MAFNRRNWPVMVRLGLWGLGTRMSAWTFFWGSLAIAAGCFVYGFVNPLAFSGVLFVFASLWYYLSIRWVDQHRMWS